MPLQTEQGQSAETVCEGVRLGGILTADAIYGLGIRGDASVQGVVWPTGYTARRDANGIVLLDRSGRVAAREGERIALDGVVDRDGINRICWDPEIEVSR